MNNRLEVIANAAPRNDTIKKWSLSLFIIIAIMLCPKFVFAAASISLSGSTWAIGTKGASAESTSTANAWTITNDSGGTEDVNIKVATTGTWTASTDGTQTTGKFVLRKDSSTGQVITATDGSLVTSLTNNSTNSFGLYFKAPPTGSEEGAHTLTVTLTATNWVFACGGTLTINHTSGTVDPATVTIGYGTVTSTLSGASKCWITQNLGASQQATSATDTTQAATGWFWQFNRKRGYAIGPSPAWTITSIDENSTPWASANDPCTIDLGTGWRLPTNTEWTNVDANGGWNNSTNAYASVLKLHTAGLLSYVDGHLQNNGSDANPIGAYWSNVQSSWTGGRSLDITPSSSALSEHNKANGLPVRCIKD